MYFSLRTLTIIFIICLFDSVLYSQLHYNAYKISTSILIDLVESESGEFRVLVMHRDQADAEEMQQYARSNRLSPDARSAYVINELQQVAAETSPELLEKVSRLSGVDQTTIHTYYVVNAIELTATAQAIAAMSLWDEVRIIEAVGTFDIEPLEGRSEASAVPNGREWGHDLINAPAMWDLGYTGYGRKALIMDSGVDPHHYATMSNFWGHNVPVDHAWSGFGGYADYCSDHGPHVAGTVVGIARYNNDTIGVAFNGHWMGGPISFSSCNDKPFDQMVRPTLQIFQWALDPDGDPTTSDDMPDAINCSFRNSNYSCGNQIVITLISNLYAAGIAVIFSGGNTGPDAGTVCCAAAYNFSLVNTFAVGAVNINSSIAGFSSRGPSPCTADPGPLSIKPEVVAPGVAVRSSVPGNAYANFNGTSMAAPHVTGAVLLLREAFPYLDAETILLALYYSAIDLGAEGEDNVYGNGLIDVFAAYEYLMDQDYEPAPPIAADNDIVLVELISQNTPYCKHTFSPSIAVQNAGVDTVYSFTVNYHFKTNETIQDTFLWEGVLPPRQIVHLPLGLTESPGTGLHVMIAEVSDPNGAADPRHLNNRFKKRVEILNLETIAAMPVAITPEVLCAGSFVTLEVTEQYESNQSVRWYNAPEGGVVLADGPVYSTGPVLAPLSVYADLITTNDGGKASNTVEAFNYVTTDQLGLVFDALQPFRLKTVTIHATAPGVRFIQLRNASDNLLASRNIILPEAGTHVIPLNIDVPAGNDLQLIKTLGQALGMNYSEQNFPYEVEDILSIKRSTGLGNEFLNQTSYHFFYDWVIETNHGCGRTEVEIQVGEDETFPLEIEAIETEAELTDGEATLSFTAISDDALTYQWNFGNYTYGEGSSTTATYTTPGNYIVAVTAIDDAGCSNAAFVNVTILGDLVQTVQEKIVEQKLSVFPNPAGKQIHVLLPEGIRMDGIIRITDINGRIVQQLKTDAFSENTITVSLEHLPAGVYSINTTSVDGGQWIGRFVKH